MNFMEKLTEQHKIELSIFLKEKKRTQEEIRRAQGILLVSEGISTQIIESLIGLEKATIVKIRKKYIKNGIDAIISKRKEKQSRSLLTKQQRADIANILHTKTPRNYGWECDYWTPRILGSLILELYAVKCKSVSSMHLIFKQSKFTFQNAVKPKNSYLKIVLFK